MPRYALTLHHGGGSEVEAATPLLAILIACTPEEARQWEKALTAIIDDEYTWVQAVPIANIPGGKLDSASVVKLFKDAFEESYPEDE